MMVPNQFLIKFDEHACQVGATFAALMKHGQTVLPDVCEHVLPCCNIDNIALQEQ